MKTSFISIFALFTFFLGVYSAAVEKRQADQALTIVTDLFNSVTPYTGAINATATSITPDSTDDEKTAAASSISANFAAIQPLVESAVSQVQAIPARRLAIRQDTSTELASEVALVLEEISGASNLAQSAVGLASISGALNPLISALSQLLLALEVVVNDLLALVQEIVDDLLTGLATGLSGLGGITL